MTLPAVPPADRAGILETEVFNNLRMASARFGDCRASFIFKLKEFPVIFDAGTGPGKIVSKKKMLTARKASNDHRDNYGQGVSKRSV